MTTRQDTSLPDEHERRVAVDPELSVVVQAPAGAGKTTLLVERFLRLLTRVDRPEEILAITFTIKAATEMRERVLKRLNDPEDVLGGLANQRSHERGWGLAEHPSRLHIQTIDSFARTLATRLPLTSGINTNAAIAENPTYLHQRAAARTIHRIHESQDQGDNTAVIASLLRYIELYDNQVNGATHALADMLGRREQWIDPIARVIGAGMADPEALRDQLDSTLETLREDGVARLHKQIGSGAMREFNEIATELYPDNQFSAALTARQFLVKDLKSLRKQFGKEIEHTSVPTQNRIKSLGKELREHEAHLPILQLALLPADPLSAEELDHLFDVCLALFTALQELETEFKQSRNIDFTAIMLAAQQALAAPDGPTDLALAMDYRLKHILIDEFQDTSTAQFELFKLLASGFTPEDGRTFFVVGDPMQSIYGFRDADVARFFELQHAGLADIKPTPVRLTTNFRSDVRLIEWANQTFARVIGSVDEPRLGRVAFVKAEARRTTDRAAVRVQQFAAKSDELAAIVRHVQTLLAVEDQSRIAILVQARTHLPKLLAALNDAGINYTGRDLEPLSAVPVVRDILNVATILSDPDDRIAWFAVLRAPFVGLSLIEMEALAEVASLGDHVLAASTQQPALTRLQRAYSTAKQSLFEVTPRESIEQFLFHCGAFATCDTRAQENALLCLDRIESLGARGFDIDEVELSIEGLFAAAGPPTRLEILTAHKSKGLEWEHVILPFLDAGGRADQATPVRWQAIDDDQLVLSLKEGAASEWLKRRAKDKSDNEKGRLLYVACTRARDTLSISWTSTKEMPGTRSLAARIATACEYEQIPFSMNAEAHAEESAVRSPPTLRRLNPSWTWEPPADSAQTKNSTRPTPKASSDLAEDPQAAAIGDCVHMALARLCGTPLPDDAKEVARFFEPEWRMAAVAQGVSSVDLNSSLQTVRGLLDRVLADPEGRRLLGTFPESDVETEHTLVLDGRLITVRFDRMFVDERGTRWIVDWKSTLHTSENLATEVDRYRAQLARYRQVAENLWPEPVRTALYFTALPKLVEVS